MTTAPRAATLGAMIDPPQPSSLGRPRRRLQTFSAVLVSILTVVMAAVMAGCGVRSSKTTTATSTGTTATTTTTATSTGTTTTPTTTTTPSAPPTVINSSCKPPSEHPEPVILVPGTYGATSWQLIGSQLADLGYCVYTFTYGNDETGNIPTSAQELAAFVSNVLTRTGARRVDIVGHSEGGTMPRYYIKFLGGADKVSKLVALAPSNHGTLNPATFGGALTGCLACAQQQTGSSFLTTLNAGDETPPPVNYTVIETMYDEVIVPFTSAFLTGPAARVTNITLQQQCPRNLVGHLGITTDPVALQWVENALASDGPAEPSFVPTCSRRSPAEVTPDCRPGAAGRQRTVLASDAPWHPRARWRAWPRHEPGAFDAAVGRGRSATHRAGGWRGGCCHYVSRMEHPPVWEGRPTIRRATECV
jgi:triacylglycerol lipase